MGRLPVKVADEVWIAAALLHFEQPGRSGFSASEIVERVARERMTEHIRPGVAVHVYQHCVANRRPNPGNMRMLYVSPNGDRRLYRTGDDYHPQREGGKQTPRAEDMPPRYVHLLDWYRLEYNRIPGMVKDLAAAYEVSPSNSVFDSIREIWRLVPEDEMRRLPADGAAQHDRYLREA